MMSVKLASKFTWVTSPNAQSFLHQFGVRCGSPARTLYSANALGVDGYERTRARTKNQFAGIEDKFKDKMRDYTAIDSKNMVFTEDLKNIVHLANQTTEDYSLVLQMLQKFNQQNKHLRFGNFVFGPVVMRMYYTLNEPQKALETFNDPSLDGLFDQLSTCQILCDLLHRNSMYQEVLNVFDQVKIKQIQGFKYPRQCTLLTFAACYKLNNAESYEYTLQLLSELKEAGIECPRRAISFAATLALNQNAPQVALEILSLSRTVNYYVNRNLKIAAMADLDRPEDAFPVMRFSVESDIPQDERKPTVFASVLEKVQASVDRMANKETTLEFEKLRKGLTELDLISKEDLDSILNTEIQLTIDYNNDRKNRPANDPSVGRRLNFGPRRNPAYNQPRQSSHYEY